MSSDPTPRRKGKDRYTVVFLPNDQTKKSRSFSVNVIGIIIGILGMAALLIALVFMIIVYTPIGAYLPINSPELERRYGNKVIEIQKGLDGLAREVTVLREYNRHLRNALGENSSKELNGKQEVNDNNEIKKSQLNTKRNQGENVVNNIERQLVPQTSMNSSLPSEIHQRVRGEMFTEFLPLSIPVIGYQTRDYSQDQKHEGIDLVAKEGSPVVAAANGAILFADWTSDDGYMIIVNHGDGYTTVYKHNRALLKNRGDIVKRGEPIALLGNTGRTSLGPHLHFEVWNNGVALNPANYIITIQ